MATNFDSNDAMVTSINENVQVILDFKAFKVTEIVNDEVKREIHFKNDSFSLQDYHNFIAEAAERATR